MPCLELRATQVLVCFFFNYFFFVFVISNSQTDTDGRTATLSVFHYATPDPVPSASAVASGGVELPYTGLAGQNTITFGFVATTSNPTVNPTLSNLESRCAQYNGAFTGDQL